MKDPVKWAMVCSSKHGWGFALSVSAFNAKKEMGRAFFENAFGWLKNNSPPGEFDQWVSDQQQQGRN